MTTSPMLEHRVVSATEMAQWPVDRKRSGEKLWAETTWGGDAPGRPKLFNWNTWPGRVVFEVTDPAEVVCAEACWRRSSRSIRLKGLKLVSATTGAEIPDAILQVYDQERVVFLFRPAAGPGLYFLYYGASEPVLFQPAEDWQVLARACAAPPGAVPLRIEARCALDSFYPMETIALKGEIEALLARHPAAAYLVFPEDRDRPIKLTLELPADWALRGPAAEVRLAADRNEYRVFQLGLWACRSALEEVRIAFSELSGSGGTIPADRLQCLTLESRIKSRHIERPSGSLVVPVGQVRALWCGIDLPSGIAAGEYAGTVTIQVARLPAVALPLRLTVSNAAVTERGDHELHRLSRLRWIESDVGLSDRVYAPYKPLRYSPKQRVIQTWGHTLALDRCGLPASLAFGRVPIMSCPLVLQARVGRRWTAWQPVRFEITRQAPGFIEWMGQSRGNGLLRTVQGRMEYDGCPMISIRLQAERPVRIQELILTAGWRREQATLASGMGYRGRRDGDRIWNQPLAGGGFGPALWMGSLEAGMGWITWDTGVWEDATRSDAVCIRENRDGVLLQANLGAHALDRQKDWSMEYALRPTPVRPPDSRHWEFRYIHKGGDFMPSADDTPASFLGDGCKRLDELKAMGVRRLNLHDWWGPSFNYPWQWEGPDNLARLTEEAHKRKLFVKVYESGRELSTLAPEFWGLVHEGSHYRFPDRDDPEVKGLFQDAWHENHLPDGMPQGWPRLPPGLGNEHAVPVSNATRNGNFYLESMRYMTRFFGTDGAYWDGADGPTLGHREMAKRLWVMFHQTNPNAVIDVHHGHNHISSPVADHMLCFPFIDSLWHGEGFDYERFDPWTWLVEIAALPFGVPSEMLSGEEYFARGMLFGIWPRAGWGAGTEKQRMLWQFFDQFGIGRTTMIGWWVQPPVVTVSRPETLVTAFRHPTRGVLLAIATWHQPLAGWMRQTLDVALHLDRRRLRLPAGELVTNDIFTGEALDILKPVPLPSVKEGRLLWVRGKK